MRVINKFTVVICLMILYVETFSQTVQAPYEVSVWPGFRSAAISFTFDDNTSNQLLVAIPLFDEFDYKATLFTVTNWSPNWNGLKQAAANGHEVASHTVTHPYLNQITEEQQTTEQMDSYNAINTNIPNQSGQTFAYPYCVIGNKEITKQYYFGARGCQGFVEQKTPTDIMNISSIICGSEGSVKTVDNFKYYSDQAVTKNGLCVYLLHGVDNDGGWSSTESPVIRGHLEYLKANENKFWVETFGNIIRYIKERNSATVIETSVTENLITIMVTDTLDNAIFNYPVTIRRPLPDDWLGCDVAQNGSAVTAKFIDINSIRYVMFDAVPDAGEIQLVKNNTVGVNDNDWIRNPASFALEQNYPNPFNPSTVISYQLSVFSKVQLEVYDLLGREVATLVNEYKPAGTYEIEFDGSKLISGVYFYQLCAGDIIATRKLMLMK
ncbi:MAG: polysaccharide deacetylase family protein [bacterium]